MTISIHTYERAPQLVNTFCIESFETHCTFSLPWILLCFEQYFVVTHCPAAQPYRFLNTHLLFFLLSRRRQTWTSWIRTSPNQGNVFTSLIVGFCSLLDRDIPYSPSFILDLPIQVDPNLRNIIDFVFIPGFNNPTLAVLFQTQQTWTGQVALSG